MSSVGDLDRMTAAASQARLSAFLRGSWAGVAMLLGFYLLVLLVFTLISPWFFSFKNMMSIGANMSFIGLMSAAQTPLIIAGGLDLSVAAVAGLAGVIVAQLNAAGLPIWPAALVALLAGGMVGAVNGMFTTKLHLNPLIVTLGVMSVVTGLALVLTGGLTAPLIVAGFNWIGSGEVVGLPVPLLFTVALYLALGWALANTPFGRFVYAAGGNSEASRLIGVPVERTLIILYVFSGVVGAFSGLVLAAMLGASAPDAAGQHLLTVIAAVVLGGTSLFGGRGSVWGTALAVLILGTLDNGLTLMDVSSFWQNVARGIVLLLAVSLDQIRTQTLGD
jgi:ribose transport system permease protein